MSKSTIYSLETELLFMKVGQQDDSSSHLHRTYVHSEHMSSKRNIALNSHHVNLFQIIVVVSSDYKQ